MSSIRAVAVVTGLLLAVAAEAQTSAPPAAAATANGSARPAGGSPPANAASPAAAAADVSAMERAQRAAAGPMRMILEASRVKRRDGGDVEADPAPAPARRPVRSDGSPAPVLAGTGAAGAAGTAAAANAPAANAVVAAPSVAPSVAPSAVAPAVAPPSAPVTAIVSLPELPATGAAAPVATTPLGAVGRVAAPELPGALPSPQQQIAAVPLPPTPTTLADERPRLRSMVEPEVPQRVLDQLTRGEVLVEFTIRRDGSVVGVNLPPPAPRQLARYVAEAVEQWRFEPQAADRQHRVVLVFSGAR